MVSFESLGAVSYSPSIVTMAVSLAISDTFSVKEWPDLEIWLRGHSRSVKLVPFESVSAVSYSQFTATIIVQEFVTFGYEVR